MAGIGHVEPLANDWLIPPVGLDPEALKRADKAADREQLNALAQDLARDDAVFGASGSCVPTLTCEPDVQVCEPKGSCRPLVCFEI